MYYRESPAAVYGGLVFLLLLTGAVLATLVVHEPSPMRELSVTGVSWKRGVMEVEFSAPAETPDSYRIRGWAPGIPPGWTDRNEPRFDESVPAPDAEFITAEVPNVKGGWVRLEAVWGDGETEDSWGRVPPL